MLSEFSYAYDISSSVKHKEVILKNIFFFFFMSLN